MKQLWVIISLVCIVSLCFSPLVLAKKDGLQEDVQTAIRMEFPDLQARQIVSGDLSVYDANGIFLGIYLGTNSGEILIYIPKLDATAQLDPNVPRTLVPETWLGDISCDLSFSYDSPDLTCSSTPYLRPIFRLPRGSGYKRLIHDRCNDEGLYYITGDTLIEITQTSYRDAESCSCSPEATPEPYTVYELIPILKEDIPFPVPIVFPVFFSPLASDNQSGE